MRDRQLRVRKIAGEAFQCGGEWKGEQGRVGGSNEWAWRLFFTDDRDHPLCESSDRFDCRADAESQMGDVLMATASIQPRLLRIPLVAEDGKR